MSEVAVALTWLYSTLSADMQMQEELAPGGVWRTEAPPSTASPYVILTFQPQQSRDEIVFGRVRAFSEMFFEVCAAGPAKITQATASAADRIDDLLTVDQQTAISGGTLMSSYRTQPFEADFLIEGEAWTNIGGVYLIRIKAS